MTTPILDQVLVAPGTPAGLADRDTARLIGPEDDPLSPDDGETEARAVLGRDVPQLARVQRQLWASGDRALLVVFQALDAAGKDSAIRHVMSGVNPQGVEVVSFRRPSAEELDHDFLWRIAKAAP